MLVLLEVFCSFAFPTFSFAQNCPNSCLDFAPNLASLEKPTEKTTKTGKAEKVAEQPAGTVADESKKAA